MNGSIDLSELARSGLSLLPTSAFELLLATHITGFRFDPSRHIKLALLRLCLHASPPTSCACTVAGKIAPS